MTMGEKIRSARLEAGLSQRQLCEGIVTRNMLSQIENGSAKPSLSTLQALALRLDKNVQFFLEDAAAPTPPAHPAQQEDDLLLHWALAAIRKGEPERAQHLIAAVETPGTDHWHLANGCLLTAQASFSAAIPHLRRGEASNAALALENLEVCCRETGDFKEAYLCACKLRELK